MLREFCGGCGGDSLEEFLHLGYSPPADAFLRSPSDPETTYELGLNFCHECKLVQLTEVVPDEELFNEDYTFYSGASKPIQEYNRIYAKELINRFAEIGRDLTVEIACNDGDLLQHFDQAGWKTLGIDPAGGPTTVAREEKGLNVATVPFNLETAETIRTDHGRAGLIIANNVLAHVADPNDFLQGVKRLLRPGGVVVMEVQYLGDLIAGNMFDHVYHEHRFYFSLTTLRGLFARNGLVITGARRTAPQGGSLRIIAVHNGIDPYTRLTNENWLSQISTYATMQGRIDHVRDRLLTIMHNSGFNTIAGYAATAKSTTLLNYCMIRDLEYIVDTTPAKIGRFTPGTHIPIISPEQELHRGYPDAYLLLAWNYLGAILRNSDIANKHSSKWIVPIPMPVIL